MLNPDLCAMSEPLNKYPQKWHKTQSITLHRSVSLKNSLIELLHSKGCLNVT